MFIVDPPCQELLSGRQRFLNSEIITPPFRGVILYKLALGNKPTSYTQVILIVVLQSILRFLQTWLSQIICDYSLCKTDT